MKLKSPVLSSEFSLEKRKSFDLLDPKTIKKLKTQNEKFNEELKVAAEDLEAFFIQQMLKEFRNNPFEEKGEGLFPKSLETDIYQDFQDEGRAKNMAKAGGIGLGKFVYEQLKREIPGEKDKKRLIDKKI